MSHFICVSAYISDDLKVLFHKRLVGMIEKLFISLVPVCPVNEIKNGKVDTEICISPTQCEIGATLNYTCDNGFIGTNTTTSCFDNHNPVDSVSLICDIGLNTDSANTSCHHSRFWDPQPACTIVTCPAPIDDNGNYTTGSDTDNQEYHTTSGNDTTSLNDVSILSDYTFNTSIVLKCKYGYEVTGPTSFTCLADGTWDQQISTCVKIICNETNSVSHEAVISIPRDLGVGVVVNVSYNSEQFGLSDGGIEVECQVNRSLTWIRKPTFGKYVHF